VSFGRALFAASAVLLSASCSLFIDTTGFVEPGDPDSSDGATNVDGASPIEAASDVALNERCKDPSVIVCETFDGPAAVEKYPRTTDPSTSVTFDTTGFLSPPGSSRFLIQASTSNTSPDAVLRIEPDVVVADFAIDAGLFIEYAEPGGAARLVYLSNANSKSLIVEQSGAVIESGEMRAQLGAIPTGRWLSVKIEIRTSKPPATGSIRIGDATTNTMTLHETWTDPGKPIFRFGVSEANSPTRGWLVRWDDVVIRRL
jgi:hypothetical protein